MLDYILHAGSENVVIYFRDNIYIVKYVFFCCYMVSGAGMSGGFGLRRQFSDIGEGGKRDGTLVAEGRTWSCRAVLGYMRTGDG